MIKRLVLFLVRKKLGLKKFERFRFANQKSKTNWYFFGDYYIWKVVSYDGCAINRAAQSSVSLNYLLSGECKVVKVQWE